MENTTHKREREKRSTTPTTQQQQRILFQKHTHGHNFIGIVQTISAAVLKPESTTVDTSVIIGHLNARNDFAVK